MIYLLLFYEYFKTGLFAVGGGMATLPFLYGRLVHRFGIVGATIFSRAAGKKNRSSSGNSKVQCHSAQEYLT